MTGHNQHCIVLYLLPVLNPKSYDRARVLEASGRPMLVIGHSSSCIPSCNTMTSINRAKESRRRLQKQDNGYKNISRNGRNNRNRIERNHISC